MSRYIYPPDWIEEEVSPKQELTEEEKTLLKNRIRNKLIQVARPILLKDAVEYIQKTWLHPRDIFIPDHKVLSAIKDLKAEIGYPGQERLPITDFVGIGSGRIVVTVVKHGYSNGAHVKIILTDNYDGTYLISDVLENSFVIEAEWMGSESSGFLVH